MLSDLEIPQNSYTVIESDYYNSQYKSAAHFHSIQQLCNKLNVTIIRVNGIAEHSKEEVEHVGGLAKVAVRKAVAQGEFFADSTDAVSYLKDQLKDKENLTYVVIQILEEDLSILRPESQLKVYPTTEGSSKFQVMLFKPNSESVRAAERLCV